MSEPKTPESQETKPIREIDEQTQKHIDRFLQGKEVWNQWANEMLARKEKLENAGKWKVQKDIDDQMRWRTISDDYLIPEIQIWLDEAFIDFSNIRFYAGQSSIVIKDQNESDTKKSKMNRAIFVDQVFMDFSDFLFPSDTEFKFTEFSGGDTFFERAKFRGGYTSFGGAKFTGGNVSFREAEFSCGDATFMMVKFSGGHAIFEKAEFSGGEAEFCGAEFTGGYAIFRETKFTGGCAYFDQVKFHGSNAFFRRAAFTGGNVSFSETEFIGEVDFTKAQFKDEVDFKRAQFESEVHFREVQFSSKTGFIKAHFKDQVWFLESQFKGETNFWLAQFDGEVDFRRTKFEEVADFREVDFKRHVDFALAKFEKTVDFEAILVKRAFSLADAKFTSNIPNYTQANFAESPRLDNIEVLPAPAYKDAAYPMVQSKIPLISPLKSLRYFWNLQFLRFLFRSILRLPKKLIHLIKYVCLKYFYGPLIYNPIKHLITSILHGWNKFTNTRRNKNEEAHYRALKRLAIQAHDHENEMKFFAGEIRARRHMNDFLNPFKSGLASTVRYIIGVAYELFSDFGRSFIRPIAYWGITFFIFANLTLSGAGLEDTTKCHNSQLTPNQAAYTIGLKNSLLILGLTKTNIVKQAEFCLYGLNKNGAAESKPKTYDPKIKRAYSAKSTKQETTKTDIPFKAAVQGITHSLLSLLFIFLLLLAIRNQFKIK